MADGMTHESSAAVDVDELAQAQARADQLQHALTSRLTIEQAKGILAERFGLTPDQAFNLLRTTARTHRRNLHTLATEIVANQETPGALIQTLARSGYAETAHEHQVLKLGRLAGQMRKARLEHARRKEAERRH